MKSKKLSTHLVDSIEQAFNQIPNQKGVTKKGESTCQLTSMLGDELKSQRVLEVKVAYRIKPSIVSSCNGIANLKDEDSVSLINNTYRKLIEENQLWASAYGGDLAKLDSKSTKRRGSFSKKVIVNWLLEEVRNGKEMTSDQAANLFFYACTRTRPAFQALVLQIYEKVN